MPLINGRKYSCEPCIRGHRATSCAHDDRVLVEVRKPGRPLQSCGHRLDTCNCGRLSELFNIGDILPDSSGNHFAQDAQAPLTVATIPRSVSPKGKSKSRSHSNSTPKVTKKSKKKVASPILSDIASAEAVVPTGEMKEVSDAQISSKHSGYHSGYSTPTGGPSTSPTNYSGHYGYPAAVFTSSAPLPGFQDLVQYQGNQYIERRRDSHPPHQPQRHDSQTMGYSSRIEDISIVARNDPQAQPVVRSQYIMATQGPVWKPINGNEEEQH